MSKQSRWKKWLLRLGLMLGTVCVALLLIEGLLQLFVEAPRAAAKREFLARSAPHYGLADLGMMRQDPHPDIRFGLTPGFDREVGGKRYRINKLGLRGPEQQRDKAAGRKRVLLLGDSYAFGLGVDQEEHLGAVLARQLAGEQVEVLNLGVPAYHSGQQLALLRRDGFAYTPDVVVLVYFANDNVDLTFLLDPEIRMLYVDALPLPLGVRRFMAGSVLYSYVSRAYTRVLERKGQLASTGTLHWPRTQARLRAMAAACKGRQVPFVLVCLPGLDSSAQFFDPGSAYNEDHDRVLEFCAAQAIPCVDGRAVLQAWSLAGDARLSEAARGTPAGLVAWVAQRLGREEGIASGELLGAYQEAEVGLRPIEGLFCIPTGKFKDSHLSAEGYRLLAAALAAPLRRALGLDK